MSIVFDSVANLAKVTQELEHLPQSARDLLGSRVGVQLGAFSWNKHAEWAGPGQWTCCWTSMGADVSSDQSKGLKPLGRIILCTDLYRQSTPGLPRRKLEHAESSLLTCCFIAGTGVQEEVTYFVRFLKFDAYGWPIESDSYDRHLGGRLLAYKTAQLTEHPWIKRSWIFAVPLEAIRDQQAFRNEISDPFWAILHGDLTNAFPPTSLACVFPPS